MTKPIPKYRKNLNSEQLEVLELLYKFRFGSNDLIAGYFGKKQRGFVFKRLKILEEQGFIGKRFDSSYRIKGRPAAYYLLPKGARKLQEHRPDETKDDINIKAIYKDKSVSEMFIAHSQSIFALYNQLKSHYSDKLNFFTKSDLLSYDYFPQPLPDSFVTLETNNTRSFFIEILEDNQPFFTAIKKIKKYTDYNESGEWIDTGTDFPAILFICESNNLQKKLQKQLAKQINDFDDCIFATTTKSELQALDTNDTIWQRIDEPDKKLSLNLIL